MATHSKYKPIGVSLSIPSSPSVRTFLNLGMNPGMQNLDNDVDNKRERETSNMFTQDLQSPKDNGLIEANEEVDNSEILALFTHHDTIQTRINQNVQRLSESLHRIEQLVSIETEKQSSIQEPLSETHRRSQSSETSHTLAQSRSSISRESFKESYGAETGLRYSQSFNGNTEQRYTNGFSSQRNSHSDYKKYNPLPTPDNDDEFDEYDDVEVENRLNNKLNEQLIDQPNQYNLTQSNDYNTQQSTYMNKNEVNHPHRHDRYVTSPQKDYKTYDDDLMMPPSSPESFGSDSSQFEIELNNKISNLSHLRNNDKNIIKLKNTVNSTIDLLNFQLFDNQQVNSYEGTKLTELNGDVYKRSQILKSKLNGLVDSFIPTNRQ